MEDYYYQDAQGQLRGPSTLQVLHALKELGLITAQTLVQDGVDGVPFPYADLAPKVVTAKSVSSNVAPALAPVKLRTVDRWGCMARTYFSLAQLACFLAAVLVPLQTLQAIPDFSSHSDELRRWVGFVFVAFICLLEYSFFSALFFVFAFVKRRGLGTD